MIYAGGGLIMTHPYIFSIVMAAYNAQQYLTEAVDSLKEQTLGFENIQLIIVDDGSTDNTPAMADSLAKEYPNILVIHKDNGGVSSARNAGLPHIQGEYINFMDSDDKISPQTLERVYQFFMEHQTETDVAVIPIIFFEARTDEHILNFYKKETRVADLKEHPEYVAMHIASSYIRNEAAQTIHFDTRLAYAEDARALVSVLLKKQTLGIVSDATYWYRRHDSGVVSAMENTQYNPKWYQPHLDYICLDLIRECLDTYGEIPRFVKYTLAYDLQAPIKLKHIPETVLDEDARDKFFRTLFEIYSYIDDDIILAQKNTFGEHKLFILSTKHNTPPEFVKKKNNIKLYYGENKVYDLNRSLVTVDFIKIDGDKCSIEGTVNYFPTVMHDITPYLIVNGKPSRCELTEHTEELHSLDHLVMIRQGFIGHFTLDSQTAVNKIQLMYEYDGTHVLPYKYRFGKFVPLDITYSTAYGLIGNYILQYADSTILLEKSSKKLIEEKEKAFIREVRDSGDFSEDDILLREKARKFKSRRPIWLISDRYDLADDNGEAYFLFLQKHHPYAVKSYFVLAEGSRDYQRMNEIGPVVSYGSQEHKLLYLTAQCVVSSHADKYVTQPFEQQNALYKDLVAQKPFVFLQHGVIKDDMSGWLNRYNKNFYGFITTTEPEYVSLLQCKYFYTENEVWLTGLPRHDRLYNAPEKLITIMPTWRRHLLSGQNQDNHWIALPGLETSNYVSFYRALLNDPTLHSAALKYGYTIAFKPHPAFMDYLSAFSAPESISVLDGQMSYRDIFAKSSLILTDYSSVAFDFAYLRKPIIYCQSDKEEFFSGEHIYSRGYFDYERDGFGEMTCDLQETVQQIISYMENGCTLKEKYRERIDNFYAFHDKNCCKRVYKNIRKRKPSK